jgi:hypothetical protein
VKYDVLLQFSVSKVCLIILSEIFKKNLYLLEHQQPQNRSKSHELIDDNVDDKMTDIKPIENISILPDPQNNINNVHKSNLSVKAESTEMNIHLMYIKQSIKSRLTTSQTILLVLNLIGIIIFLAVVLNIRKRNNSSPGIC